MTLRSPPSVTLDGQAERFPLSKTCPEHGRQSVAVGVGVSVWQPYHRISLYEGGAVWIDFLVRREPALLLDLEALFQRMGIQGAAAPPKNGGYYS